MMNFKTILETFGKRDAKELFEMINSVLDSSKEKDEIHEKQMDVVRSRVSTLNEQLLNVRSNWKHRLTSRKFLLVAPSVIFTVISGFYVLFYGQQFSPMQVEALKSIIAGIWSLVLLFVAPEAYTDYKERIK